MHIIANELMDTFCFILHLLHICTQCIYHAYCYMLAHTFRIQNLRKLLLLPPPSMSWQPNYSMGAWSNYKTFTHM